MPFHPLLCRDASSAQDSEYAAVTSRPGKVQGSDPAWCIFLFLLASTLWTPGPHPPPLYYSPHCRVHTTPLPGGNMSFRKGDPVEVSALTAIRGLQEMPGGPVKGSQSLPDKQQRCTPTPMSLKFIPKVMQTKKTPGICKSKQRGGPTSHPLGRASFI